MGLLENIKNTNLGFKGNKPQFNAETSSSTLHNTSSVNGKPYISRNPSTLDEQDTTNTSKYNSSRGKRYLDNLPK